MNTNSIIVQAKHDELQSKALLLTKVEDNRKRCSWYYWTLE